MKKLLLSTLLAAFASGLSAEAPWTHGPLRVSADGRSFQQADGTPFFWLGDTTWLMTQKLTREEVKTYFENRRAKGFNVVQLCVVQFLHDKSIYGSPALVGDDITKLNVTPGADPADPAQYDYWDHVDYVIATAAANKIYVAIAPVWSHMVRRTPLTAAQVGPYIEQVAQRYKDRANVIWLNGGSARGHENTDVWQVIGDTLQRQNPQQLVSYHPFGRTVTTEWFKDSAWLDFHMFTSGHRTLAHPAELSAKPGERVTVSAEGSSDPDGDTLSYLWLYYYEAGTFTTANGWTGNVVSIENADQARASFVVPTRRVLRNGTMHVIVAVTDNGTPAAHALPARDRQRRALTTMNLILRIGCLLGACTAVAPLLAKTDSGALLHDIEYGRAGSEALLLDAAVPAGKGPFPTVILVHGGGWTGGNKAGDIAALIEPLAKAGFVCLSINYRLAPQHRWPACRDDVLTAIRWAKAHAAEFKGDSARIALIGYSAGGHLVCSAATVVDDSVRVQAVVGLAPLTDFVQELPKRGNILGSAQRGLLNRPQELTPESVGLLRAISPVNHLRPGLPPFLLIHGDADGSVPYVQSVTFQARLRELGVGCDLITLPGAPHRLSEWEKHLPGQQDRMIAWLREVLVVPPRTPDETSPPGRGAGQPPRP